MIYWVNLSEWFELYSKTLFRDYLYVLIFSDEVCSLYCESCP